MPRAEEHVEFLPSILDRLLDPDAEGVRGRRGYSSLDLRKNEASLSAYRGKSG
ncbi:MAG TPA: hypothetical protein VH682_06830 [Gemmataceae bacterium]|jgi:hypothetical protein